MQASHQPYEGTVANDDLLVFNTADSWRRITFGDLRGLIVATRTRTEASSTYTAVPDDAGRYLRFTSATPSTFIIPTDAAVALPVDTLIEFEQAGAGALTIAAASGVTILSRAADYTLAGQHAVGFVKKVAANTWTLNGDL